MRDVRRNGVGRELRGGPETRVDGVISGRPQSFRHQHDQWTTIALAQDGGTRGGTFHGELIAVEKVRARIRHAVVCPNVTGRTKERIAQSKRARAGSLAVVD